MSQETISLPTDCFHDKWLSYYWLTGIFWRVYCLLSSVTEPLLIQDTNPLLIIIANEPCLEGLAEASTWWKICSHSMTVVVSVREKLDMDSLKNARTMILVILFIFTLKKKWWRCEDDRISFWSISSPSFGAIPGSKCRELLHLLISLYEKCCEQKALLITKVSKRTIFYIRVNSYNQITHLVLVDGFTCYCKCLLLVYLRKSGALTIMCWKSSSDRRPSLSRSASSITFSHTILTSSSVSSLRVSLFNVFSRSDLQMKSSLLKSYRKNK